MIREPLSAILIYLNGSHTAFKVLPESALLTPVRTHALES